MFSVLNTLSEYTFFYISKNISSYTFLIVFKIIESLQCILKAVYPLGCRNISKLLNGQNAHSRFKPHRKKQINEYEDFFIYVKYQQNLAKQSKKALCNDSRPST